MTVYTNTVADVRLVLSGVVVLLIRVVVALSLCFDVRGRRFLSIAPWSELPAIIGLRYRRNGLWSSYLTIRTTPTESTTCHCKPLALYEPSGVA